MQMNDHVSCLKTDLLKSSGTFRVLVAVTGSVAALKLPLLVSQLLQLPGVDVRVVTTEHAKHFYDPAEISVKIYSDKDEWETCVVRAWDTSRPLLFCPAMNTAMWHHPITAQQVSRLTEFGYVEIPCIAKKLVCGDEGKGAMAEVSTIVSVVQQYLQKQDELSQTTCTSTS
ncbi:phosphopantothenoylcysteine decarboxylase isoform X2 [Acanthopagrus latus]|uniref:phosphopantothenoylcysteine decarboxylase isoform X2 n=1 Tax=Acanthopagrus latus TaxID=8177 RepID=UPI00187CD338|nr:phosphopantothenoylcysteine decarboxylase isoform X2 [Acanthopagrus latus]